MTFSKLEIACLESNPPSIILTATGCSAGLNGGTADRVRHTAAVYRDGNVKPAYGDLVIIGTTCCLFEVPGN